MRKDLPSGKPFFLCAGWGTRGMGANYKQATLNLIQNYQGQSGEDSLKYSYAYLRNGAELEKIRVQERCK